MVTMQKKRLKKSKNSKVSVLYPQEQEKWVGVEEMAVSEPSALVSPPNSSKKVYQSARKGIFIWTEPEIY